MRTGLNQTDRFSLIFKIIVISEGKYRNVNI